MHTEKEATKLMCPTLSGFSEGTWNFAPCQASGCLAWRWDWRLSKKLVECDHDPVGYCGLSGVPQTCSEES